VGRQLIHRGHFPLLSVCLPAEFADRPRDPSGADRRERSPAADPRDVWHSVADAAPDRADTDLAADGARQGL